MIVADPAPAPVTVPDVPTEATPELLLDQLPPVGELDSVVVAPRHTVDAPERADGVVFTVTGVVTKHEAPNE